MHILCSFFISDVLYLSFSILAAKSSRSLTERRISHILSVCTDGIPAELPASGITHMRIPIEDVDYADLLIHLPSACRFIDHALRSQGVVLVHCVQGLSRSAAVVAAYCELSPPSPPPSLTQNTPTVMYSHRINASQALEVVRRGLSAILSECCISLSHLPQRAIRFGQIQASRSSLCYSSFANTHPTLDVAYIKAGGRRSSKG